MRLFQSNIFCCVLLLVGGTDVSSELTSPRGFSPDYTGKVNVRVSDVLTDAAKNQPVDRSWPPENSDEFSRIDIRVMGERIDSTVLHNLRPNAARTKTRRLRRVLGHNYQNDWMSITKPVLNPTREPVIGNNSKLLTEANRLNFTFVDASGAALELPHSLRSMMRQWMVDRASCPMEFIWEDLGPLFWPRWIRRGVCLNSRSCSWPKGMRCRPNGSKELKLLRWVCSSEAEAKKKGQLPDDSKAAEQTMRNSTASTRQRRNKWRKNQKRSGKRQRGRSARRQNRGGGIRKRRGGRKRRIRRIIRRLSLSAHGYYCQWEEHQYSVNDNCACTCF